MFPLRYIFGEAGPEELYVVVSHWTKVVSKKGWCGVEWSVVLFCWLLDTRHAQVHHVRGKTSKKDDKIIINRHTFVLLALLSAPLRFLIRSSL